MSLRSKRLREIQDYININVKMLEIGLEEAYDEYMVKTLVREWFELKYETN